MTNQARIIRTQKDRDHPYVVINTTFATDTRLSWEARGLMVYLLSKPDDWEVQIPDLVKQSRAGRDKVYRILKELEECGYLARVQEQAERGKFGEYATYVYETPRTPSPDTAKPEAVQPEAAKPDTDQPDTAKPDVNKYGKRLNTEKLNRECASAAQAASPVEKPARTKNQEPRTKTAEPGEHQALFDALAQICKINTTTMSKGVRLALAQTAKRLAVVQATPEDVQAFRRWWDTSYWIGQRGDVPTPNQVGDMWDRREDTKPSAHDRPASRASPGQQPAQYQKLPADFDKAEAQRRTQEILRTSGYTPAKRGQ